MEENTQRKLLNEHFGDHVQRLARRVAESTDVRRDYHALFADVDDDLFLTLLASSEYPEMHGLKLPAWPSEAVRRDSTADIPFNLSILEAALFWRAVRRRLEAPQTLRVADYGAGWGRISRFAAKDVRELVAFEPNPVFCTIYEDSGVPGRLVSTDWHSEVSLAAHGTFDAIYCFSILTHSSDALTRNIAARWKELTQPGSLVFATIRPRFFIEGSGGDADLLADRAAALAGYDAGRLVYERYAAGDGQWGVTVMPLAYVRNVFDAFEVTELIPSPLTPNQVTVVMRRR